MPAPRRPWPPSQPSRPPSLHESACERPSLPQLPFSSSSRDPSLLAKARTWRASGAKSGAGKPWNSLRARSGGGCGVRKRRRRVVAWAARRVDGVEAWSTAALGDGGTCGRRRGEVQAAAAATRAGGAEWLRGRRGERARTAHGGGSAGARRRCGGTAAARREGGGAKGSSRAAAA